MTTQSKEQQRAERALANRKLLLEQYVESVRNCRQKLRGTAPRRCVVCDLAYRAVDSGAQIAPDIFCSDQCTRTAASRVRRRAKKNQDQIDLEHWCQERT